MIMIMMTMNYHPLSVYKIANNNPKRVSIVIILAKENWLTNRARCNTAIKDNSPQKSWNRRRHTICLVRIQRS